MPKVELTAREWKIVTMCMALEEAVKFNRLNDRLLHEEMRSLANAERNELTDIRRKIILQVNK